MRLMLVCLISLLLISLLTACQSETPEAAAVDCQVHFKAESYKVALRRCEEAAELGDLESQWLSGRLRLDERAGKPDLAKATDWFRQAAERGHTRSQREYGISVFTKRGTEAESGEAYKWLLEAARKDDREAQFFLGLFYLERDNDQPDPATALNWFNRAGAQGHTMAQNNAAWIHATSPIKALRNGKLAVKLITPLVEAQNKQPVLIDTYAAALAEVGRFEEAVQQQTRAISYLPEAFSADQAQGYIDRLALYQAGKTYTEELNSEER